VGGQETAGAAVDELQPDDPDELVATGRRFDRLACHQEAIDFVSRALRLDPGHSEALRRWMEFLRNARRFDEAEDAAGTALDRQPGDPDLHVEAGWLFDKLGRYQEAIDCADRALELDPEHSWALRSRVDFLWHARRFHEAEDAARTALDRQPRDPDVHVATGRLFQTQVRHQDAIHHADRALELDPEHSWALRSRVEFLQEAGRFDEAEDAARTALDQQRDDPDVHVTAGWLFEKQVRYQEAIDCADRALELDPEHSWALRSRVEFLWKAGRFAGAEEAAQAALDLRPGDPDVYVTAGWLNDALHRFEDALACFDRALSIDADNADALEWRTRALRKLCRFDQAGEKADEALGRLPGNPRLRLERGWVCSDRGRWDEALAHAEYALGLDPWNSWALRSRVEFLQGAGRFSEAETAARAALDVRPEDPEVHVTAGWLAESLGRHQEAADRASRALKLDRWNSWALRSRVAFLRKDRRFSEAEEAAQAARRLRAKDPDVHVTAGWLFVKLGRYQEAVDCADRALELDPENPWALRSRMVFLRVARRFTEAEEATRTARELRPRDPDVHVEAGWLYDALDRFQDALPCFNAALDIDPIHAEALEWRTTALRKLRRYDEAEQSARNAIDLRSEDASLYTALGFVHDDRLEFEPALDCYATALELQPADARICLARSATLRSLGRFAEAERDIRAWSERYPNSRALRAELAWIHHDERRYDEARRIFQSLVDTAISGRERSIAWEGLGWIAFTSGHYREAERQFRDALSKRQGNLRYKLALAWALARQDCPDRQQEAESLAREVNEQAADPFAHVCLGVLAFRRGRLASAEYDFKRALEIDPYHGSHTDLGALYAWIGKYDEAESELNQAIGTNWYDIAPHVELGSVFLKLGEDHLSQAEQQFRQALAIDPSSGAAGIGLAQALASSDEDAEAESVLRRLLLRQDVEQRWRVHLALGRLLFQRGDKQRNENLFAEAYAEAQKAIDLAPNNEAEPHFLAGISYYQMSSLAQDLRGGLRYQSRAIHHLDAGLKRDKGNSEANRNRELLEQEQKASRPAIWSGYAVASITLILLSLIWISFFLTSKVSTVMITSTTPILVGLFVVAALLPSLIRLKLPGFEADLEPGAGKVSSGPTGEVTFAPGRFTFPTGPTGQLPRRA
jgi:tetratricopeptide (TPR) repeat protein